MTMTKRNSVSLVEPRDLLSRLEHQLLQIESPCFAAFDADHTLWDADVGVDVFEALLHSGKMHKAPAAPLKAELLRFSIELPADDDVNALASALHQSFLIGKYPDDLAYAMHAWTFAGFTEQEARHFADDVARSSELDKKIRPIFRDILSWMKERHITPLVVSASPAWMVHAGASLLGLNEMNVLAMTPDVLNGTIQPIISGPVVYGEGKAQVLQKKLQTIQGATLIAAFGDSAWDAAMLRLSKNPVAVTPKPELLSLSDSIAGLVEMAIPKSPDP